MKYGKFVPSRISKSIIFLIGIYLNVDVVLVLYNLLFDRFFSRCETGLPFIKELLEHSSSRPTAVYAHLSRKSITNIIMPIERAFFLNEENEIITAHNERSTTTKLTNVASQT